MLILFASSRLSLLDEIFHAHLAVGGNKERRTRSAKCLCRGRETRQVECSGLAKDLLYESTGADALIVMLKELEIFSRKSIK